MLDTLLCLTAIKKFDKIEYSRAVFYLGLRYHKFTFYKSTWKTSLPDARSFIIIFESQQHIISIIYYLLVCLRRISNCILCQQVLNVCYRVSQQARGLVILVYNVTYILMI